MQINVLALKRFFENLFWTLFYNADHCDVLELTGDAVDASRGLVDSAVALEAGRGPGWILQMQQHDIDDPNVVPAFYFGFPFCI